MPSGIDSIGHAMARSSRYYYCCTKFPSAVDGGRASKGVLRRTYYPSPVYYPVRLYDDDSFSLFVRGGWLGGVSISLRVDGIRISVKFRKIWHREILLNFCNAESRFCWLNKYCENKKSASYPAWRTRVSRYSGLLVCIILYLLMVRRLLLLLLFTEHFYFI